MQHTLTYSFLGSLLPILVYLFFIRWMDRYEKEPLKNFALVFLYGAVCSFLFAYVGNTIIAEISQPFLTYEGHDFFIASLIAPLIEEFSKGIIVVALLYLSREFNSFTDGLVYGAVVGLGFAFSENLMYFERTYQDAGIFEWIYTIYLRGFFLAGVHASASVLFGAGCGYARTQKGLIRVVFVVVGYVLAVMAHSFWNSFVTVADIAKDNVLGYVPYVAIPFLFFLLFILFEIALNEEREKIKKQLTIEANSFHTLPLEHVMYLCSFFKRGRASWFPKGLDKEGYLEKTTDLAFALDDLEKNIGSKVELQNQVEILRFEIKGILGQKGSVLTNVVILIGLISFFFGATFFGMSKWRQLLFDFPAYHSAETFIQNHPIISDELGAIIKWDKWPTGRFWYNQSSGSGYIALDVVGEKNKGRVKLELENELGKSWAITSATLQITGAPLSLETPLSYKNDAQFYINQNQLDKAVEICNLISKMAPNDYVSTDCWGLVSFAKHDDKAYVDLYLNQKNKDPDYYVYQLKYGQSLLDIGQNVEAIDPLLKAWEQKQSLDVANELAAAYLNSGQLGAALNFLHNAETFDTKKVDDIIQFNYGIYYYKQKKYNEAIPYFEETLKINPDYYRAYLMLADCYFYLNEADLVVSYMEQGLSRNPYNQEDRRYLIKFLLDYGRVDEAVYHAIRFGDYASDKGEANKLYEEAKRAQR